MYQFTEDLPKLRQWFAMHFLNWAAASAHA